MGEKILMPTLTPSNFRCPAEAAGLGAEPPSSLSQFQAFPGCTQSIWYQSRIPDVPTSLHYRGGADTILVLAPSLSDQHGMHPGLPLMCSHINITHQEKLRNMLNIFLLDSRCSKVFSCRSYTMHMLWYDPLGTWGHLEGHWALLCRKLCWTLDVRCDGCQIWMTKTLTNFHWLKREFRHSLNTDTKFGAPTL